MKPYRKIGIIVLGLLAAVAVTKVMWPPNDGSPAARTPQRPNILLIMADDLGNNDIGLFGDGSAQTPNIDALARAGARYRRHYANATCRPSRMALLTGMSSSRVGVPPHVRGISPEIVTLPEALAQSGYATMHIGKWHLGHHVASAYPDQQGFDDWYGFLSALQTKHGGLRRPERTYIDPWLQGKNSDPVRVPGHMTDLLTEAAVTKISQLSARQQPWFINLWYFAPHEPIEPAPRFARRFADSAQGRYLAMVAQLDASVGRLIAALEAAGARDNTLVVFLSDNGGTNRRRDSNKPYFGKKNTFMEGGLRTPFILNFPRSIEPVDIMEPVFISDVMPTLLAHAGVSPPLNISGRSVLPLLAGGSVARNSRYFWDFQVYGYAKYGVLDLVQGLLVYEQNQQLWDPKDGRFLPAVAANPAVLVEAGGHYRQWMEKIRRVDLQRERLPDGSMQIAGDSYRRTPGFGGWTLQLPVAFATNSRTTIQQPGQFLVEVAGAEIRVDLPGLRFSAQVPATGCRLLSLSSYYRWSDRKLESSWGRVGLYLDEDLLYEKQFPTRLDILEDLYEPTLLSAGAGQPVVSNDYLHVDLLQHYQRATGKTMSCGA